ncbi:MAG: Ribosomal protein S11 [Candidatus Magasanikbacteria bacterium GW2011_GWA2_40_10]|uniref:Small ribosomal subunit protein uS11 n=1 Tax=Candidatus Magasanikbacteria bacterium GW2011_GWA2_40_10 TaxID=1619037 RepID=A0A0G0T9V8_9BACT|nr:MAG: Ribosomal protein S11 [Candidatus Magasanikbacteria bacterium GW2011_GWA2_40_10]
MSDVQSTQPEEVKTVVATTEKPVAKSKKKKVVRQVVRGNAFIQASYNNTIVSITDPNGDVLGWSSSGKVGFKGPKKATPYASSVVVKDIVDKLGPYGMKDIHVFVKGIGGGREGAIRALHLNGLNVLSINDVTPIPHNGCRAPRKRRV